jgi:uncharacterized membrane protein YccC
MPTLVAHNTRPIPSPAAVAMSLWGGRIVYSTRTAVAAVAALYVAMWMQIDVPRWTVLTVIFISPPTRGDVLRKSIARAVGTPIGCVAAVALAGLFPQDRLGYVLGLGLWIGACGYWATFRRGYVAYGAILAGFTAAVVGGDTASHPEQVFDTALARGSATMIGVLVAMVASTVPQNTDDVPGDLADRVCRLAGQLFDWADLRGQMAEPDDAPLTLPLLDLDAAVLNALAERPVLARIRPWLQGLPTALLAIQSAALANELDPVYLRRGRELLRPGRDCDPERLLAEADRWAGDRPAIAAVLAGMAALLTLRPPVTRAKPFPRPALVRDRRRAIRNLVRAVAGLFVAFLVWDATAWSSGPVLLTQTGVLMIMFVAAEDPAVPIRGFFIGTLVGVVAALLSLFVVLPMNDNFAWLAVVMGSLVALTAIGQTWPALAGIALGFGNTIVTVVAPSNPQLYNLTGSLNAALALVGGTVFGGILSELIAPPRRGVPRAEQVLHRMRRAVGLFHPTADRVERMRFETRLYDDLRRVRSATTDPAHRRSAVEVLLAGRRRALPGIAAAQLESSDVSAAFA